jgi:L-glutamine-phosphate cytidylyltransferase
VHAIILAAGVGTRLRDRRGRPKCLQQIGGVPLVHHQLAALAAVDVTDVTVVVGHAAQQVRDALGDTVRYMVNPAFRETNSLYSFLLAGQRVRDDVVVLNGDVFLHPALLARLAWADGDALLYDSTSGHEDEHMKVSIAGHRLVAMSKEMPEERICGENVGALRLSAPSVNDVVAAAREIVAVGDRRAWLASAINRIASTHPITCIDVAPWPWVEIDFPEDLVRARAEVLPALASATGTVATVYAEPVTLGSVL